MNKVIIIGAPRSGTNMLRDLLVKLDGFETWPCDEINYIWRHGNRSFESDQFSTEMVTPSIERYINGQFERIASQTNASTIVEKTCANSLRVGFVNKAVPDAKYVFIVRDGRDAVASALKRWKAKLDIPYLFKKAKYVPVSDLPYYALSYFYSRVHKLFSSENRLGIWGPRLDGIDRLLKDHSLEEVCAIQWQRCVESSERDLRGVDENQIYRINYEDFVLEPARHFRSLAKFLTVDIDPEQAAQMTSFIKSNSIGRGREELANDTASEIAEIIKPTLSKFGYIG